MGYLIRITPLIYMVLLLFVILGLSSLTASQTIVKSLPGYPGNLPFKLETGYIGVGEDEDVQVFYFFVESEGNPEEDPLVFWLSGGPGCSNFCAFFYELGPFRFKYGDYTDNVPTLGLEPHSWTKVANMVYLDAPKATGYSYTKTPNVVPNDTSSSSQTVEFVRKFVKNHPKFSKNPLYISGISYSGIIVPIITEEIYKGNDDGLQPILNIKGYMMGNPLTDKKVDIDSRLEYIYRMALISNELFESTGKNCNGEYAEADSNNLQCKINIENVNKRIEHIYMAHILEPNCESFNTSLIKGGNPIRHGNMNSFGDQPIRMLQERTLLKDVSCRNHHYTYARFWANDENVKKALNIRKGTLKEWLLCNENMTYFYGQPKVGYEYNIKSSVVYHANLTRRNCRALVFSGDHDLTVPHIGTRTWINSLNLTITGDWDAWYVEGQEAGYKTTYARNNYSLVFTTVKGAGHTAPEYKPKECFEMVKRWFAHKPI